MWFDPSTRACLCQSKLKRSRLRGCQEGVPGVLSG